MKRSLALVAVAALFTTALADNTAAVKKQLTANYSAIAVALKGNKIDKLGEMLTDDYVVVLNTGQKQTKSQVIAQFKGLASHLHNTKWVRTIQAVTLSGNQAVATVSGSFSGDLSGQDGTPHKLTQNTTSKDIWVKTPKGYRLYKSEVQKNSMTMDGQPLPTGTGG